MPTKFRAMFIGTGPSGLPEDRVVNTFHFLAPLGDAGDWGGAIADLIGGFYSHANTTSSMGAWLSPWVQRDAECRVYDLDELKPRTPHTFPVLLDAARASQGLPEECAVCLSYRGDPPHSARRRGRIYLGPLGNDAQIASSHTANATIAPAFVTDILQAGASLILASIAAGLRWSVMSSKPAQNFVPITGLWVDNALDTQRRRGPKPTARTPFELVP